MDFFLKLSNNQIFNSGPVGGFGNNLAGVGPCCTKNIFCIDSLKKK